MSLQSRMNCPHSRSWAYANCIGWERGASHVPPLGSLYSRYESKTTCTKHLENNKRENINICKRILNRENVLIRRIFFFPVSGWNHVIANVKWKTGNISIHLHEKLPKCPHTYCLPCTIQSGSIFSRTYAKCLSSKMI